MADSFDRWLDTFIEEKDLDVEHRFDKEGKEGLNSIPLGSVLAAIKQTDAHEQSQIKATLVKIDYANGDVLHFFDHLAGALAI